MQTADPGAARRPLVIANPSAGRGRTGRDLRHLLSALRDALGELDVVTTAAARQATDLAAEAAGARRPLVISLGGDGTLHEVVNGLMRARGGRPGAPGVPAESPSLGVIATGTGGDFGRALGIAPRTEDYLAAITAGHERAVDVGLARFTGAGGGPVERYWINVLSAGIGGLVDRYATATPAILGGRFAYAQAALRGIAMCRRVRLRCGFTLPDGSAGERLLDCHAVAICNGTTFGGGMRIAPMAQPDDGLLQVIAMETRTRWRLVGKFLTVYSGTHLSEPGVHHFACRAVRLEAVDPPPAPPRGGVFPLDVDGEALGDVPLEVSLIARALSVRAPRR
ncbi:MAG: diacylglycerol kinase family lipid kinase [Actinobacteria bacterium]|nr:diacylglycerol kinase family lipid kinase [Actinomycetota bacterium]